MLLPVPNPAAQGHLSQGFQDLSVTPVSEKEQREGSRPRLSQGSSLLSVLTTLGTTFPLGEKDCSFKKKKVQHPH